MHSTVDGTQGGTQGDTQSDTQGYALDIWIEDQIRKNPKITTEELAVISKKGLRTIKRHIAKLTHIKYVGSGYSGHWEIIENNAET
jgi:ATP-dependent DNA helicase RecG